MSYFARFTKLFQNPDIEDDAQGYGVVRRFFHPISPSEVRRLQFFWGFCIVIIVFCFAYTVMASFSESESAAEEAPKLEPKLMETAMSKANVNEGYWHKVEEENRKLYEKINGLETLVLEGIKAQSSHDADENEDNRFEELETKLQNLQAQFDEQHNASSSHTSETAYAENPSGRDPSDKIIQKFSLGLSNSQKEKALRTVDTTIPAGAFAKTVLLSGLDASSAMNASSDPRPMLLRLIDHGTLPRRFQSDLKDCHCTASAYGDLSSERVYARLEKLTCIERASGEIVETQVAGYITGSDGKVGIRGIVASQDGKFLSRSLVGGVFAGLSNVANPQNRQAQVNPFFPGSSQVSPPGIGEMFASGMATGATSALDRLSQYYIDRAEQLQPVIQVAAGQVVDIVFTEGTTIGSQTIKSEIEKTRNAVRESEENSTSENPTPLNASSQRGE